MDSVDKQTRSKMMSRVRAKGNKTTELRLRMIMTQAGISGWKVQPKAITGNPDFTFPELKIAVFVDGCFWHGCRKCKNIPKTNTDFWRNKIGRTIQRDKEKRNCLRKQGWLVVRIWEHDFKEAGKPLNLIRRAIQKKRNEKTKISRIIKRRRQRFGDTFS